MAQDDADHFEKILQQLAALLYKDARLDQLPDDLSIWQDDRYQPHIIALTKLTAETLTQDFATDFATPDERFRTVLTAMTDNVYQFSGFKTAEEIAKLKTLLLDPQTGNVRSFAKFKEEVTKLNATYNVRYLQAEYEHTVASAQMAAKWHELAQDEDKYFFSLSNRRR